MEQRATGGEHTALSVPTLILWDIDGTLMHCGGDGTKALNGTFQRLYGVEDAFRHAGIGSAMDSVILDRILDHFTLTYADKDLIKTIYIETLEEILAANQEKKILPGILPLLDFIEETEQLYCGLLTSNFQAGARTKLASVGLEQRFLFGGFGDSQWEKWDAALAAVDEAETLYGVTFSRENTWIIGDSAYDIQSAKKLGMKSIAVATGWMSEERLAEEAPDYLFPDLSAYEQVIRILLSASQTA